MADSQRDKDVSQGRDSDVKADAGESKRERRVGACHDVCPAEPRKEQQRRRVGGSVESGKGPGFSMGPQKMYDIKTRSGKRQLPIYISFDCSDTGPGSLTSIECSETTNAKMLCPDSRSEDICLPHQPTTTLSSTQIRPS